MQTGTREENRGPGGTIQVPIFENQQVPNPNFDPNAPAFSFQPGTNQRSLLLEETPAQADVRLLTEGVARNIGENALASSGSLPVEGLNFEGLPEISALNGDTGRFEQSIFDRGAGLLNPIFERREEDLLQSLANRGQPLGIDSAGERTAANAERELFNQERNEAFSNLALDAVRAGSNEQSRQFGIEQAARNQGIQERTVVRNQRFNELASMLGLQPVQQAQLGSFFAPSAIDVVGPQNAQFAGQLAGFNAAQQNADSTRGGLFGLASALGSAAISNPAIFSCSRAYKRNFRPVETILPRIEQLDIMAWEYGPEFDDPHPHVGPMAEQWHELFGLSDGKTIHLMDAVGICLLGIQELSRRTIDIDTDS